MRPPEFHLHAGDCLKILPCLPAEYFHTCVTSPPYWALRDYQDPEQLGNEPTLARHINAIVKVGRQIHRVLRDDGTLWLVLGDTWNSYTANTGRGWNGDRPEATREPPPAGVGLKAKDLKPKDLIGTPWRIAMAMQRAGWYLRSEIIWHKKNPKPERTYDRPTRAHETLFLFSKSLRYYYDAQAIAEPNTADNDPEEVSEHLRPGWKNRRDVWTLETEHTPSCHAARFPVALARLAILAGTSATGVCSACGSAHDGPTDKRCEHPNSRRVPARVLDPFAGIGTTGLAAIEAGRDCAMIELNPDYCLEAAQRCQTTLPLALA